MVDYSAEVQNAFAAIQFRTVSPSDPAFVAYVADLQANGNDIVAVANDISTDTQPNGGVYTQAIVDPVILEYQAAFGRVPDQAGQAFWVHQVAANPTAALATLSVDFANSAEFGNRYGGANASTTLASDGLTAFTQVVTLLYENVLQRAPDAGGLSYWVNSGLNAAQLLQAFASSPEFITDATPFVTNYQALQALDTPPPTTESLFQVTQPGLTFELTTGVDTFVTSQANAVFNAIPAAGLLGLDNTLNTGDSLLDNKGDGTLNFTAVLGTAGLLANPGYATGVTINGVSTLNISNQASVFGLGVLPAGFQGNVTGLTTVNDTGSVAGVQLGNVNQGLNTALQTVNINQFAGSPLVTGLGLLPVFSADIAAKVGSAANALTVNLNGNLGATKGLLAPGGAAIISIATDGPAGTAGAPNLSYGTQTYNTGTNTATYLQLEAQSGGFLGALTGPSVDGTTNFVFKGGGTLAVGQDFAGDHQLAQNIDASGTTGSVFITGAASGFFLGNAIETAANPGALFGSAAGFLDGGADGIFGLTKFELGSGTTYFDASGANATELAALTTTPNVLVPLNNTNEIVVNDAVAATTLALTATGSPFADIKGFNILGIGGAVAGTDGAGASGGTYNMANLPTSINEIIYQTTDSFLGTGAGGVTISNQAATLTVNVEDNASAAAGDFLTVSTSGGAETLNLVLGNPLHPGIAGDGNLGTVTLTGDGIFNITAAGNGAAVDTLGFVSLTPVLTGNEVVTIGDTTTNGVTDHSTQALTIGDTTNGAIADFNPTTFGLNLINLTINDTSLGAVTLLDATVAGPLNFVAPGDTGPALSYSTNAVIINAASSGGLIMDGGDANFVPSSAVSTSVGDTITGSTTHGNVLGGSIGNDAISAVNNAVNTIYTDGGQDTIVLSSSHTAHNAIDFYAGETAAGIPIAPGTDITPIAGSITNAFGDQSQLGWSGLGAGGVQNEFGGIPGVAIAVQPAPVAVVVGSGGTSADMSLIQSSTGGLAFNVATDSLGFAVSAWGNSGGLSGSNAEGGVNLGLTNGDVATAVLSGAAVSAQVITPGLFANAGDTLLAGTNLIELNGSFTGGASQVANTLINIASQIWFNAGTPLAANADAHMLVAYQNGGSVDIADVTFEAGGGALVSTGVAGLPGATSSIHVSDIVQLTGVSLASFEAHAAHAVHFV